MHHLVLRVQSVHQILFENWSEQCLTNKINVQFTFWKQTKDRLLPIECFASFTMQSFPVRKENARFNLFAMKNETEQTNGT